jgi:hypothetical protein
MGLSNNGSLPINVEGPATLRGHFCFALLEQDKAPCTNPVVPCLLVLVFPVSSIKASDIYLFEPVTLLLHVTQTQDDKDTVHSNASLSRGMGRHRRNSQGPAKSHRLQLGGSCSAARQARCAVGSLKSIQGSTHRIL